MCLLIFKFNLKAMSILEEINTNRGYQNKEIEEILKEEVKQLKERVYALVNNCNDKYNKWLEELNNCDNCDLKNSICVPCECCRCSC